MPMLQPLSGNIYSVKDFFSFVKEIFAFPNQNYFMASFDVTSLITNIPLNEVSTCTRM